MRVDDATILCRLSATKSHRKGREGEEKDGGKTQVRIGQIATNGTALLLLTNGKSTNDNDERVVEEPATREMIGNMM